MTYEKANILYLYQAPSIKAFETTFMAHYHVFIAQTPKEALEILNNHKIAIVIAHQSLSDISGESFLKAVSLDFPDTLRMLIAEDSDTDLMIKAINEAHIFRFLTQPVDENELQQSIDVGIKIYNLEQKNRRYITKMHGETIKVERLISLLHKYVPSYVVDETLNKHLDSLFKGEIQYVTIMFTHINNFETFIKKTKPALVIEYLKNFLEVFRKHVNSNKGTIDKFFNGSTISIFGAPIPFLNTEYNAVFTGLDLIHQCQAFNAEFAKVYNFETSLCIGINSGETVVGNIGSGKNITYTALGETVNYSYQLLKLACQNSNTLLISHKTHEAIKDYINATLFSEEISPGQETVFKVIDKKSFLDLK